MHATRAGGAHTSAHFVALAYGVMSYLPYSLLTRWRVAVMSALRTRSSIWPIMPKSRYARRPSGVRSRLPGLRRRSTPKYCCVWQGTVHKAVRAGRRACGAGLWGGGSGGRVGNDSTPRCAAPGAGGPYGMDARFLKT